METATDLEVIDRDEFLRNYWEYKAGEHVTLIGPTQRGKTTLGFQLLKATTSPDLRGYVLVSKPRDETVDNWQKPLGYGVTETWPPPVSFRKKPGWFVRPPQSLKNLEQDERELKKTFKACIMDCYASTDGRIVFADEAHELQNELRLKKEMEAVLMRGSALKTGLWSLAQRSAYNSYHIYSAPKHLFLFNDPDRRNRIRFGEIGGVDPDVVMYETNNLDQFQALYINRDGPYLCVVNP